MFKKRKDNKILKEYIDLEYEKLYELVENELDQKETLSYEEFQFIIISIYEVLKKSINKEDTYKVISQSTNYICFTINPKMDANCDIQINVTDPPPHIPEPEPE